MSTESDNRSGSEIVQWRETGRQPMLGPIDGRALFPLALFFLHMRAWTLYVALAGVAGFWMLNLWGITPVVAWRIMRVWAVGKYRPKPGQLQAIRRRMEIEKL